jgi:UDP-N-acetylmuramate dehydrogenase
VTGLELGGAAVAEDVPLAPLTTLRIGPVARRLITCTSTEQIVATLRSLDDALVLAGGSNVVLADDLTDLTVVLLANTEVTVDGNVVRVEAGAAWDDVVVTALAHGLGGLECLSGIPGSAGATPVQNVGAYGAEVADVIRRVRLLDRRTGEDHWVSPEVLEFGYRTSILKHSQAAVVLEVEFALNADGHSAPLRYGELAAALDAEPGSRADPTRVREAVLALRAGKGMVLDSDPEDPDHDTWSVGSFFTNPVVTENFARTLPESAPRWPLAPEVPDRVIPLEHYAGVGPVPGADAPRTVKLSAAWLIEHAGVRRGFRLPGSRAAISSKHTLALTNTGGATADEIAQLARYVQGRVAAEFGVILQPEPVLIGVAL